VGKLPHGSRKLIRMKERTGIKWSINQLDDSEERTSCVIIPIVAGTELLLNIRSVP